MVDRIRRNHRLQQNVFSKMNLGPQSTERRETGLERNPRGQNQIPRMHLSPVTLWFDRRGVRGRSRPLPSAEKPTGAHKPASSLALVRYKLTSQGYFLPALPARPDVSTLDLTQVNLQDIISILPLRKEKVYNSEGKCGDRESGYQTHEAKMTKI